MSSPRAPLPTVPDDQPPRRHLYQCGTCFQSYTRVDHLTRHVRSRMYSTIFDIELFFISTLTLAGGKTRKKSPISVRYAVNGSVECEIEEFARWPRHHNSNP
jgi:hypothetical protein